MDKTILVILDACRFDAAKRNLGYIESLIDYKKGAKYRLWGELPSLSRTMYATMLTGLPAWQHGITDNEVNFTLTCDHLFSLCRRAGGVTAAASYGWMSELFDHGPFDLVRDRYQLESEGNISHGIYYVHDDYPDNHLFADGEYLRKTYQPDFLLYHSMAIDRQGHLHGAGSVQYEKAVCEAGYILAGLLPQWLKEGWQVVITADHGMNEMGIHGGTDSAQREIPLYIFSDKVRPGRFEEQEMTGLCVAPLLCRLLGITSGEGMIHEQIL